MQIPVSKVKITAFHIHFNSPKNSRNYLLIGKYEKKNWEENKERTAKDIQGGNGMMEGKEIEHSQRRR